MIRRFFLLLLAASCCFCFTPVAFSAEEDSAAEKESPPVQARLIAVEKEYVLPADRRGMEFRQKIESETDDAKLPSSPKVNLVLELKNISQEEVMIWPRGLVTEPELIVEGPGVVYPENLMSLSGGSSATSVQPVIAPGKTHRIPIDSLNPGEGTPFNFWCEPGEYKIKAKYRVHTNLPPFPIDDGKKPAGPHRDFEVETPFIIVKVVPEK